MSNKIIIPNFIKATNEREFAVRPYYSYLCYVIDEEFASSHFSDKCSYLNDLFEELEILLINAGEFYLGLNNRIILETELKAKNYGPTFRYLLLLLIKNEMESFDNKYTFDDPESDNHPNNKIKWVKDSSIEKLFYGLAYKWRRNLIPLVKQGYYLFSNQETHINSYITLDFLSEVPKRQLEFNVEIYNSISHYESETPIQFFYLLYEYLEIVKRWYSDPLLIINSIKDDIGGKSAVGDYLSSNKLSYWLLIAIKNRIGFDKEFKGDFETSINLFYKLLNNEAKTMNCSPDQDPEAPIFPIPEPIIEQAKSQETNTILEGHTNSQIVLIFYYFFNYCGLEVRKDVDISTVAKFIHLITGKDFSKIADSDFYSKLKTVPNFSGDKKLIENLNSIKPLFEKAQLKPIVTQIDNEIETARKELKSSK